MRHFIHRASFIGCIVCLLMIPIGIIVRVTEWGDMPLIAIVGYFVWAWTFAIINHVTRKPSST